MRCESSWHYWGKCSIYLKAKGKCSIFFSVWALEKFSDYSFSVSVFPCLVFSFNSYVLLSFLLFPIAFHIFYIFILCINVIDFLPRSCSSGSFDLVQIWMDKFQRMIVIKFYHCWMSKWKRMSNRKSCFVILNEAPKCSHLLSNFSFIIYSILENNYFQCKHWPTLPFVVYSLIYNL